MARLMLLVTTMAIAFAQDGKRLFEARCASCHGADGAGGERGPNLVNDRSKESRREIISRGITEAGMPAFSLPRHELESLLTFIGSLKPPPPVQRTVTVPIRGVVKNESNFDLQILGEDGALHLFDKATGRDVVSSAAGPSFEEIAHPKPGEWPTYNGQLNGNRHSELKEIDTANVARLSPKWMFTIPNAQRLQVTPVVVEGVMYVTAANEAFALDARSGRPIWHYKRPLTKGVIGDASSAINRGVAVLGAKVFMVTDHAHLIALDRITGALLWDTEIADFQQHYGMTSAPLVVNDLVLVGTSGGDEGARGFIAAVKASNGELAWKSWTIPAPGEPGSETWVGRAIEHGCSAPWLTGSYDPEVKLVYWTTGNPCPDYNGDERQGDNLYSSSVLALDPATGQRRWHFQFTPHDLHDWDASQPVLAVNADFQGTPRKLLLQASRNGFFYVLDRVTGEFLLAEPFVHKMTWASKIGKDGRPVLLPGQEPTIAGTKTCPAVEGASNWMSSAFNPSTRLFYVMALERCNIYTKSAAWWEPGKSFYGGDTRRVRADDDRKALRAIDIQTGKVAWEYPQIGTANSWGGALSTAGGLVFFGEDSGAFAAVDARTGKLLWSFQMNQVWKASPMTYSTAGKQFVAVASGGSIVAFGLP